MELTRTAARRATCDRGRSGCVIVRDRQVLVTGYVGSPKGLPHCDDVGHLMKKVIHDNGSITQHCMRTVHAEQNAITQAARRGIALDGGTLYCRMTPCRTCSMLIINCGIELMGSQVLQRLAAENDARAHTAQAARDVFKQIATEGLQAALRDRDAPFGDSRARVIGPEIRDAEGRLVDPGQE